MGGPSILRELIAEFAARALRKAGLTVTRNEISTVELSQWIRRLYMGTKEKPATYREILKSIAQWTTEILGTMSLFVSFLVLQSDDNTYAREEKARTGAERRVALERTIELALEKARAAEVEMKLLGGNVTTGDTMVVIPASVEAMMEIVRDIVMRHQVLLMELVAPETPTDRVVEILNTNIPTCGLDPSIVWSAMLSFSGFSRVFYEAMRWVIKNTVAVTAAQHIFLDINGCVGHIYLDDSHSEHEYIPKYREEPLYANEIGETDLKTVHWIRKLVTACTLIGIRTPQVAVHSVDNDLLPILLLNTHRWRDAKVVWHMNRDMVCDVNVVFEALINGDAREAILGRSAAPGLASSGWGAIGTFCLLYLLGKTDYTRNVPQAGSARLLEALAAVCAGNDPLPLLISICPSVPLGSVVVNTEAIITTFKSGLSTTVWSTGYKEKFDWTTSLQRVEWVFEYWLNGGVTPGDKELVTLVEHKWVQLQPVPSGENRGWMRNAAGRLDFTEYVDVVLKEKLDKLALAVTPVKRNAKPSSRKPAKKKAVLKPKQVIKKRIVSDDEESASEGASDDGGGDEDAAMEEIKHIVDPMFTSGM